MPSLKNLHSKTSFGINLIMSLIILLMLSNCEQKKDKSSASQPSNTKVIKPATPAQTPRKQEVKRKPYPQKAPAGQHFYLTKNYSVKDLDKIKKKELAGWGKEVNQEFGISFKTKYTQKYFNIAYRSSEEQMNFLLYTLKIFFKQMYPVYFKYEPTYPFKIVYFKNKKEFSRYTGSEAYGFYLPKTKTLYTYANSGEGTLWHELIHAFVDANIDHSVQQWFSEGFASFYEMGAVYANKFHEGYTNWRHPTLKKQIRKNDFLPLNEFLEEKYMSEDFGYAKARFLFCYLWINNKMPEFVKTYLYDLSAKYKGDKLGEEVINTMEKMLGKNIYAIEKDYKAIALTYGKFKRLKKRK